MPNFACDLCVRKSTVEERSSPDGRSSSRRVPGRLRADDGQRPLDISAGVLDGRPCFAWSYTAGIHRRETIAALADATLAALREPI